MNSLTRGTHDAAAWCEDLDPYQVAVDMKLDIYHHTL